MLKILRHKSNTNEEAVVEELRPIKTIVQGMTDLDEMDNMAIDSMAIDSMAIEIAVLEVKGEDINATTPRTAIIKNLSTINKPIPKWKNKL